MTTTVPPRPGPGSAVARPPGPPGMLSAINSEWIKLRTVRSTFITLAVVVILGVGLAALFSWGAASSYADRSYTGVFDPTSLSLASLGLGQLAVAVLGTLVITSEYSSGMIRTSLIAIPRRPRLLGAKAVAFTAVMVVVGEVTAFGAFLIGQVVLSVQAPSASLGQSSVLRAVIGAGLYLAVIGLLSLAVGALLRNTAASIAVLVAFVFVVPIILRAVLPDSIRNPVIEYWPTEAGSQILSVHRSAHTLSAWTGFGLLVAFALALLALAAWLMAKRDA